MENKKIIESEIDFLAIKSDFKSTEFLSNNMNNNTIIFKNVIKKILLYEEEESKVLIIDLILNKFTEKAVLNQYSNTSVNSFNTTTYTLSDLRRNDKNKIYTLGEVDELKAIFEEYYLNKGRKINKNIVKSKNIKKDMFAYLILMLSENIDFKLDFQNKLDNPIKIVMQDETLHNNTFGDTYKYYITDIVIRVENFRNT